MDLRGLAQLVPDSHFLSEVKAQGRCILPGHRDGDSDQSVLLRQNGDRLTIGCYGGLGHTTDALLTALHLGRQDLIVSRPASQTSHSLPPKAPAEAFSVNGTSRDASERSQAPVIDFPTWRYRAGMTIKGCIDAIPQEGREIIASMTPEGLAEKLFEQARELVIVQPRPPELSDTDLDDELHKLAAQAVEHFRNAYYLPATTNGEIQLPATVEIDREPIDAYDAWKTMSADRRGYAFEGLGRWGCTMVLAALIGAGKTTFAMNLARAWALGTEFLDRRCEQSKTLVVVSPKEWEAWADTIGFWELREVIFLLRSTQTHFVDGAAAQARWFETAMKKGGFRTFVLDTLFDFFGMPPNTRGDSNRIAMNEQTPLLEVVNANSWCGLVSGHSPKTEAQAVVNRDPEEAFGGHTAWTAQHRMRMSIRRKSKGMNAFVTGRGGYGDTGILEERLLLFDESTRLVSLGTKFSDYLGEAALPEILEKLGQGGWFSRSELMKQTGKSKNWVYAGIKHGLKQHSIRWNGKGSRGSKYALPGEDDEETEQAAEQGELYK
jgi:hypothetical protein